jgi:hypothetical protein
LQQSVRVVHFSCLSAGLVGMELVLQYVYFIDNLSPAALRGWSPGECRVSVPWNCLACYGDKRNTLYSSVRLALLTKTVKDTFET